MVPESSCSSGRWDQPHQLLLLMRWVMTSSRQRPGACVLTELPRPLRPAWHGGGGSLSRRTSQLGLLTTAIRRAFLLTLFMYVVTEDTSRV